VCDPSGQPVHYSLIVSNATDIPAQARVHSDGFRTQIRRGVHQPLVGLALASQPKERDPAGLSALRIPLRVNVKDRPPLRD
jgi:hypothetical protein